MERKTTRKMTDAEREAATPLLRDLAAYWLREVAPGAFLDYVRDGENAELIQILAPEAGAGQFHYPPAVFLDGALDLVAEIYQERAYHFGMTGQEARKAVEAEEQEEK